MPFRDTIFINKAIYHIFNKTIDHKAIFDDVGAGENLLKVITYYRSYYSQKHRYSEFIKLEDDIKESVRSKIADERSFQFEILSYCLMPTHYHFLIKQKKDNGIVKGFSNALNSFMKHFNKINERNGPIFLHRFKSVVIRTEEQLKHVSRYIHLNPYSDRLVKNFNELINFPLSSLKNYFGGQKGICNVDYILGLFDGNKERYIKFVEDNADYQRSLEKIKYLNKLGF